MRLRDRDEEQVEEDRLEDEERADEEEEAEDDGDDASGDANRRMDISCLLAAGHFYGHLRSFCVCLLCCRMYHLLCVALST